MNKRPKIAFFTPLNPRRCGVSDYSEDLLPQLAAAADVDLVIERYTPSNPAIAQQFRTLTGGEFRERATQYDSCVYQIANSFEYHGYLVPYLAEYPGIVVLHDFSLQYLMLGMSALQGDLATLVRFLRPTYGAQAPSLARKLFLNQVNPYEVSMVRPILDWARGVIVHSECVQAKVLEEAPDRENDIRFMRMAVPLEAAPVNGAELRSRYGFAPGDFVVASVSTLSYAKRLEVTLKGILRVRRRFPNLRFVIVGGGALGAKVRGEVERHGLQDVVRHTGWVSSEQYRDYIRMADVVTDLRYPSGTEASASLSRAIAAGKPVIVSAHGWFLTFPDSFAFKIPVNADETAALARHLSELIENPEHRSGMAHAAEDFAREHLRLEDCAASYVEFIREVAERPLRPIAAPPAWCTAPRINRLMLASVYKGLRLAHHARSYGVADTIRRLRNELTRGRSAEAHP